MALIVIKDGAEIGCKDWYVKTFQKRKKELLYFQSTAEIQEEFCSLLEKSAEWDCFLFEMPIVKEYLEQFGIRPAGKYTLECDDWTKVGKEPICEEGLRYFGFASGKSECDVQGDEEKEENIEETEGNAEDDVEDNAENAIPAERFATCLIPPIQFACVALYYHEAKPDLKLVVSAKCSGELEILLYGRRDGAFDATYSAPMLKKRDVYLLVEDFKKPGLYTDLLGDLARMDVRVVVEGVCSEDFKGGADAFEGFVDDVREAYSNYSRELDSEVFHLVKDELFVPYQTTLHDYLIPKEMDDFERESLEDAFDRLLERHPECAKTKVLVNGKNSRAGKAAYYGDYKHQPIFWLFSAGGKWNYFAGSSEKHPTLLDLVVNVAFTDMLEEQEAFTGEGEVGFGGIYVSNAEKIFAMVLDGDQGCDGRRYWEHVSFFLKYDRDRNVMEICDRDQGLLEFHKLSMRAKSLFQNPEHCSWNAQALRRVREKTSECV